MYTQTTALGEMHHRTSGGVHLTQMGKNHSELRDVLQEQNSDGYFQLEASETPVGTL